MRRPRGFTIVEAMIAVAIVGVLASISILAISRLIGTSRMSGAKFQVVNMLQLAKQRAQVNGTDVYVLFTNLDSVSTWPREDMARILIYQDRDNTLRGSPDDLMSGLIGENIYDEMTTSASADVYGSSGLAFLTLEKGGAVPPSNDCNKDKIPGFIGVRGKRLDAKACTAVCTFCEVQKGQCVGAVRFTADGQARIVTGEAGSGGLLKIAHPTEKLISTCIAIAEPSGLAVMVEE